MSGPAEIMTDTFQAHTLMDKDGKPVVQHFDRVTRYELTSVQGSDVMLLDVNSDLYPLKNGTSYRIRVSSVPDFNTNKDLEILQQEQSAMEYAMAGTIFRFEIADGTEADRACTVYASFGGLIMELRSTLNTLNSFAMDQKVYITMYEVQRPI
ncbi:RNA polymerase Rpb8 [Carpediemonas membranifera]|uniref:DNA-directed RNA polymerases I, II, and III subunit RPABC3 n=1 Tax=Carpediemonas membranifera TaxID=201153 RepID=A0A8J6DZE0_9EUKA|nr:RNA polymerase Rpb8 [Carpediemonas membranifera]|eukprot:KAG9390281.1 RNA polymerase Rpb8 [Carpediemonas membranifera]